jgi:two-component system response regulator HydG
MFTMDSTKTSSNKPEPHNAHILVVDDEAVMRETICEILAVDRYAITAFDPATADHCILQIPCDVVVMDVFMPGADGFSLREEILKYSPFSQFIFVTGKPDERLLEKAMDLGAYTFLTKPFNGNQIRFSVMGALRMKQILKASREREVVDGTTGLGLIGASDAMGLVRRRISEVAPLDIPVMITGESGTGKEVVARCIHEFSCRSKAAFTAVNCAGLSPGLIESELFGHAQGAFTGATKTKHGYFEITHGGTLFLDEIGDLPLELQAKLLRVLDRGEYFRVGDTEMRLADVRIVCATNCDVKEMVARRTFRKDLYYRLQGAHIDLEPLQRRREDIPALIWHFISGEEFAVSPDAMKLLQSFDWPGNVRQLKMTVVNLKGICVNHIITKENVRYVLGIGKDGRDAGLPTYRAFKEKVIGASEKEYFSSVLESSEGNIAKAARVAGMDRKNFYEKLKQAGIEY